MFSSKQQISFLFICFYLFVDVGMLIQIQQFLLVFLALAAKHCFLLLLENVPFHAREFWLQKQPFLSHL